MSNLKVANHILKTRRRDVVSLNVAKLVVKQYVKILHELIFVLKTNVRIIVCKVNGKTLSLFSTPNILRYSRIFNILENFFIGD